MALPQITANPAIPTSFTVTSSTTSFAFAWPWFDTSDIIVRVSAVALATSAYTVSGGPNGGTVTLNAAVNNVTVQIDRYVTLDLQTAFSVTGPLDADDLNYAIARLTARDQDISRTGANATAQAAAAQVAATAAQTALASTVAALASITTLTQTLTIASGAITVTTAYTPNTVIVDGEGGAADDLSTINGGVAGQVILLRSQSAARVITVKDGADLLLPGGDQTLNATSDFLIMVKRVSTGWAAAAPLANND